MRRVWKFPIPLFDADGETVAVTMPVGARVLHLGLQQGRPCLWAEVDPENDVVARTIQIVATGYSDVPEIGIYLGTLQMRPARGGEIVFHFYLLPDPATEALVERVDEILRGIDDGGALAGVGQRTDGDHGDVGGGR